MRIEHFHKSCLWLKKCGLNRQDYALPCICFTYTNVSGLHKPHWYRWKIRDEQDKNSSYGISNTSFIIIIYDSIAINHTLILRWLVTSNSVKGKPARIQKSILSAWRKKSPVSCVWISGDYFPDSKINWCHPLRVSLVVISNVFICYDALQRHKWQWGW